MLAAVTVALAVGRGGGLHLVTNRRILGSGVLFAVRLLLSRGLVQGEIGLAFAFEVIIPVTLVALLAQQSPDTNNDEEN